MRAALYDTGPNTTGSKELGNAYSAMAQDFDVSGSSDEITARS